MVDADLEASRTPIHELHGVHAANLGNRGIYITRHYISSIQQAAGHVLASARVALHHLIGGLKHSSCYLACVQLFVVGLLCGYDWCKAGQWKVDPRVRNQVCLELVEIDVQFT